MTVLLCAVVAVAAIVALLALAACSILEAPPAESGPRFVAYVLIAAGLAVLSFGILFLAFYRAMRQNALLLADERDRAERASAEARSANRAKSEFLSRMSHEIRTPLNGIMGMTAIALHSLGDEAKVRACLEKIDLSSGHLLALVNDILDMSKIESGKVQIKREPIDFKEFALSLAPLFGTQARERGIRYETVLAGDVDGLLVGDPLRLNQVLYNLVDNALKFTEPGGRVTLRIERLPQAQGRTWLRFSVADTGCGIRPEDRERIFDSFEQGDMRGTRRHGGTGLGLAITSRFVELMDGTIRVESTPGCGSTFVVDLPFDPCEGPDGGQAGLGQGQEGAGDGAGKRLSGRRVLIAEDVALNLEIAVELMEMAGAEVETAGNGREAVSRFSASEPGFFDLVLMDIQMPEMDGYEATEAIRALDRPDASSVVILAMTANAFAEDARRSLERGMDGHLSKPLDIAVVYDTISRFLRDRP